MGYFALVQLPLPNNQKVRKYQKVGFIEGSRQLALSLARKHYGPNAKIVVQGVRVNIEGLKMQDKYGNLVDYAPGPKQPDYSCGSARVGKYC